MDALIEFLKTPIVYVGGLVAIAIIYSKYRDKLSKDVQELIESAIMGGIGHAEALKKKELNIAKEKSKVHLTGKAIIELKKKLNIAAINNAEIFVKTALNKKSIKKKLKKVGLDIAGDIVKTLIESKLHGMKKFGGSFLLGSAINLFKNK